MDGSFSFGLEIDGVCVAVFHRVEGMEPEWSDWESWTPTRSIRYLRGVSTQAHVATLERLIQTRGAREADPVSGAVVLYADDGGEIMRADFDGGRSICMKLANLKFWKDPLDDLSTHIEDALGEQAWSDLLDGDTLGTLEQELEHARRRCEVPADEEVVAWVDATFYGSAKNALVIGSRGLYLYNGSLGKTPGAWTVPWSQLRRVTPEKASFMRWWSLNVRVGPGVHFYVGGGLNRNEVRSVIEAVHAALDAYEDHWANKASAPGFQDYWPRRSWPVDPTHMKLLPEFAFTARSCVVIDELALECDQMLRGM